MAIIRSVVVAVAFLCCAGQSSAQPIAPPVGMYCSCPPTHANSDSVLDSVASKDFVDGILVRVVWSDLEPSPGVRDWSLIDEQIARAQGHGKRISIAVVSGMHAPSWLASEGVEMFGYLGRNGESLEMPIPWDAAYLGYWDEFVRAFGARYSDEETIALVYITHSTFNGFEMQLPFSPPDIANWNAIGYSDDLLVASWMAVIDSFAEAFPRHALAHDVHPVLRSDEVAARVVAYADGAYGGRVGVLAAWWMVRNANEVYPAMFELLKDASFRSFSTVQVANSFTNTPERFGTEGIASEIDLSVTSGIRYMEVWNSDLNNPALEGLMRESAGRLRVRFGDANGDDRVDIEDLYAQEETPRDIDGDGDVDGADGMALRRRLRAREGR